MKYTVSIGDRAIELSIRESAEGLEVTLDGRRLMVDMVRVGTSQRFSLLVNDRSYDLQVWGAGGDYQVVLAQRRYGVTVEGHRAQLLKSLAAKKGSADEVQEIKAAMPGLVVKVEVEEGELVQGGDGLVIVEAMKMENEVRAPRQGIVKQVFVHQGMTVDQGQTLVLIE
jgi:biotin carboxyl carrier protein